MLNNGQTFIPYRYYSSEDVVISTIDQVKNVVGKNRALRAFGISYQQYLLWAVDQYNNKPHSALYGLTPAEVFNGMLPDKYMFKPAMQQAAKKRKEINQKQQCLNCIESIPENV